jgi:hypothetical protein
MSNAITITLDKYQYAVGETITGKVGLTITDGSIKADKLSVILTVIESSARQAVTFSDKRINSNQTRNNNQGPRMIFSFELPLGASGEYTTHEYPFEIRVPEQARVAKNPIAQLGGDGLFGDLLKTAATILIQPPIITTFLEARLDIPWHIDLVANVDVLIIDTPISS